MKKLLLTLTLCLISSGAWAQCTGVFPAQTLCGNPGVTPAPPGIFGSAGLAPAITPEQFGAVGDGSTDDTLAVQKALNQLVNFGQFPRQTVLFANSYFLTKTVSLNATALGSPIGFFSIISQGKDFTFVTSGFAALEITADDTNTATDISIFNISCEDTASIALNLSNTGACILMNGAAAGLATFDKIRFDNILGFTTHDTIKVNGSMSHSLFNNITAWFNFNGVVFTNSTGTANVISNIITSVTSGSGIFAGDGVGNVGDLSVMNWQGDGGGVGLQLRGSSSYGDNVHIDGFQWNGGTTAVSLSGMNNIHINGNWDGIAGFTVDTSTHNLTTDFSSTLNLDSLATSQNNYQPKVSTSSQHAGRYLNLTSSVSPISITGMTDVWDGKLIDILNNGNNLITLVTGSTSSSAANRFQLGANANLAPGQSITLRYSNQSSPSGWYRRGGQ